MKPCASDSRQWCSPLRIMKPGRYLGLRSELTFERFQGAALIGEKVQSALGSSLAGSIGRHTRNLKKAAGIGFAEALAV